MLKQQEMIIPVVLGNLSIYRLEMIQEFIMRKFKAISWRGAE